MSEQLDQLKQEATNLGIDFHPNIGEAKLQAKIDAHYESQAAGDLVQEKPEVTEDEANPTNGQDPKPSEEPYLTAGTKRELSKDQKRRNFVLEQKRKAMTKRVVRLTSNDKRDNDVQTTAYLGFENQFFGISRLVPLDIPVELEQCLINIAKDTKIILHKDEIKDGKRTGNKVPVLTHKFNISYEDVR